MKNRVKILSMALAGCFLAGCTSYNTHVSGRHIDHRAKPRRIAAHPAPPRPAAHKPHHHSKPAPARKPGPAISKPKPPAPAPSGKIGARPPSGKPRP